MLNINLSVRCRFSLFTTYSCINENTPRILYHSYCNQTNSTVAATSHVIITLCLLTCNNLVCCPVREQTHSYYECLCTYDNYLRPFLLVSIVCHCVTTHYALIRPFGFRSEIPSSLLNTFLPHILFCS